MINAAELGLANVPRETFEKLEAFVGLLVAANESQNLISKSTVADLWQRHIADAAQLIALAPDKGNWLDIGSGAGLTGLFVAILSGNPMGLVETRRLGGMPPAGVDALEIAPQVT